MELNFKPNFTGLTIVTDPNDINEFFRDGHPCFSIPGFSGGSGVGSFTGPVDIWLGYQDYLESIKGSPIYDQNGGEILGHTVLNSLGFITCDYILDDLSFESDPDNYSQYNITIEGFLVRSQTYEKQEDVKANVFSPIGIINDLGNRLNRDRKLNNITK